MPDASGALLELPRIDFRRQRATSAIRLRAEWQGATHEIRIPVLSWGGGDGPVTLVIGGQHGNEYQGPLILHEIIARLGSRLRGNLVIVPAVNPPALRAATRVSPLDGLDLNRSFPGAADGSPSQQIAHAVATSLVPHADVVLDVHSGGYRMAIIPSVMMHYLENADDLRRMISASRGFDLPARVIIDETHKAGMFDTMVEAQGKLFYCPELGGGMLTPQLLRLGFRFVESFLVQFGHLEAPPRPARPVRLLEVPDQTHWVRVEADGMFAAAVELNSRVRAGQSLGHIVSLDDPAAPGMPVIAPHDGIVYMINIGGRALPDQSVAVIARPAARRFREM